MSDDMWRKREQRDRSVGGVRRPAVPRRAHRSSPTTPASGACASAPTTPARCRTGPIRRPGRSRAWRRRPRPPTVTTTTRSTSGRRSPPSRRSGATTSPAIRPAIRAGSVDRDLTGEVRSDSISEPLVRPGTGEVPPAPPRREPGRITIGTDPSGVPRRPPVGTQSRRKAAQQRSGRPAGPARTIGVVGVGEPQPPGGHRRRRRARRPVHRRHAVAPGRRPGPRRGDPRRSPGSSTSARSPRRATARPSPPGWRPASPPRWPRTGSASRPCRSSSPSPSSPAPSGSSAPRASSPARCRTWP